MITKAGRQRIGTRRRGFTLIEVMIVVGIIVILAGIATVVGVQVKRSAAERSTKATLDTLDQAMGVFLKDHPEPAAGTTAFVKALQATNPNVIKNLKGTTTVLDGYGKPIYYLPSSPGKPGYFQSFGPNGLQGDQDDLFSHGTSAQ